MKNSVMDRAQSGCDPGRMTPIGIAHLTLLALTPPELVTVAAAAGYDFVGVRVKAVTEGEHQYPMQPGSPVNPRSISPTWPATGSSRLPGRSGRVCRRPPCGPV